MGKLAGEFLLATALSLGFTGSVEGPPPKQWVISKKEQLNYKRDLFISEVLGATEKLYFKECGRTGLPGTLNFGDPTEEGMKFEYEPREKKAGEPEHTYMVKEFSEDELRACVNLVVRVIKNNFGACPPAPMENDEEKLV